jgi:glyoxylase-like metal-dependent hydrolase (beta-lactamase superfamily II)
MFRRNFVLTLLPALFILGCTNGGDTASAPGSAAAPPAAPDANATLTAVTAALGATDLRSITYSGTAWRIRNSFMQTPSASPPWPSRDEITNYRRTLDLTAPASLATGDTFAQNLFLQPAVAGTITQNIPADRTVWADQLEIWLTPWGFVQGARNNGVTASRETVDGTEYTVLSWQSPATQTAPSGLRYTVNGYVGADNLIARTETWVEHPFMGDFHVVQVYSDYRDFGGVKVPATIEQQRGGGGIFGVNVTAATANPADLTALLTPPPSAAPGGPPGGAPPAAPATLVEQLASGVHLITGGYVALVAEFADHVLVFEAGQSEARGQQIVDEVKKLVPSKPIRYIVNSHPHSDHTAGLVPLIREGATLVTHANNVDFLRMALSTPRTLLGEPTLNPQLQGADGVTVFEDATMRVELHSVPNGHSDGMLVAVVPSARTLFQADFTLPAAGAMPNPFVVTLAQYVDSAGVQFDRYLAVHAAAVPQTRANLLATIGK